VIATTCDGQHYGVDGLTSPVEATIHYYLHHLVVQQRDDIELHNRLDASHLANAHTVLDQGIGQFIEWMVLYNTNVLFAIQLIGVLTSGMQTSGQGCIV
jgi:hypothetical protein